MNCNVLLKLKALGVLVLVAAVRDILPGWLRLCLGWLCSTVGFVFSTLAAAPSQFYLRVGCQPIRSLGRKRSPSSPFDTWNHKEKHRQHQWKIIRNTDTCSCRRIDYLKGISATALVVMAMWSEKSFQVEKKETATPVWSCRCTIAWGNIRMKQWCPSFGNFLVLCICNHMLWNAINIAKGTDNI